MAGATDISVGFILLLCYRKTESLPSSFLNKLKSSKSNRKSKKVQQIFTYDRDIVCLTEKFVDKNGTIKIPRSSSSLEYLCRNHLKGKIRLTTGVSIRHSFI